MPDLSDTVRKLHRVSPSFYLPPQIQELAENPEKKIFGGGMTYAGIWDRESGYEPGDVVKYNGQLWLNTVAVPALNGITGPGPPPGARGGKYALLDAGTHPPLARIAAGLGVTGTLTTKSHDFYQGAFFPAEPYKADVYELLLKESEANGAITLEGFPEKGPLSSEEPTPGDYRPLIANDAGEATDQAAPPLHGKYPGGKLTVNKLLEELPGTTKAAGGYRFYVLLYGGLYNHQVPPEPQTNTAHLPSPYSFAVSGAPILTAPGNPEPSADEEHWTALTSQTSSSGPSVVAEIKGTVEYPKLGPGGTAKLPISTVLIDTAEWWDAGNLRFVPKTAGYYTVTIHSDGTLVQPGPVDTNIMKNGAVPGPGVFRESGTPAGYGGEYGGTYVLHANGTTDYFEVGGNSAAGAYAANVYLQVHS